MAKQILEPVSRSWTTRRDEKRRRIELVKPWMRGAILPKEKIIEALDQYYSDFTAAVQTELARDDCYHGPVNDVVSSSNRQAARWVRMSDEPPRQDEENGDCGL